MPWSIPTAEAAAGTAGILAGEAARAASNAALDALDAPKPVKVVAAALSAGAAHWAAAQGTKAAINTAMVDPAGLVVGAVTTPVTAAAHTVSTFFAEIFKS